MNRKNKGFTLIELMIVIAIFAVIAALIVWAIRRAFYPNGPHRPRWQEQAQTG